MISLPHPFGTISGTNFFVFGSLLPNESRNKSYVSFGNMSDPVSNIKYTSV
jgi:hypothetical protein